MGCEKLCCWESGLVQEAPSLSSCRFGIVRGGGTPGGARAGELCLEARASRRSVSRSLASSSCSSFSPEVTSCLLQACQKCDGWMDPERDQWTYLASTFWLNSWTSGVRPNMDSRSAVKLSRIVLAPCELLRRVIWHRRHARLALVQFVGRHLEDGCVGFNATECAL